VEVDVPLAIAGLLVGTIVGLTGMGGGALMTPMLVFFFGVNPLTAISSDIVVSLLMKPAGAFVHLRRGTVNLSLVAWLCVGSMPAAFLGAWAVSQVPAGVDIEALLKGVLGLALLVAASGLVARSVIQMYRNNLPLGEGAVRMTKPVVVVKPIPTVVLGAVAGFMVGMTSVGAGSVIIVALLMMYPALKASQLVGTDLAQAIPLVAAAALGHLMFGDFSVTVAASLLLGAVPGAWFGAQISSRAPGGIIRRALAILLLASGLKLLDVPNDWVLAAAAMALVGGSMLWIVIRRYTKELARAGGIRRAEAGANAVGPLPPPRGPELAPVPAEEESG
jgi:uncharacterized membrane protein YfcA